MNFDLQRSQPHFRNGYIYKQRFSATRLYYGAAVPLFSNLADKRVPFYIAIGANPRYCISGFGATSTVAWPVYLPG